jgi:DNA-binding winged helix-turn-helix (wHTH) protein
MFDGLHTDGAIACGRFRLQQGRLLDEAGRGVALRHQSLSVLRVLLRRGGEVVTRGELLDAVWGSVAVTDDSLTQCIVEIRRVLGGSGLALRTVRRVGYLLDTQVLRPAARVALPLVEVLPFAASGGSAARIAVRGMAAELRVSLMSTRCVAVAAGWAGDVADAYRLSGEVRQVGPCLRVTVELAVKSSSLLVWAARYDAEARRGDFLSGLDAVVSRIADTVSAVAGSDIDAGAHGAARRPRPREQAAPAGP